MPSKLSPSSSLLLLTSHIRNLKEHGRHKIDTLKELEVNVHVIRHLTTLLDLLLLCGSLMLTL